MANWLGNSEHVFSERPPQLEAGNLGSLVSAILSNRLGERTLTQHTLSDAIKAEQARRQGAAYTEAAKAAGLYGDIDIPEGLGGAYGKTLADQLREKQDMESLKAYREKLGAAAGGGGGGGGGGDGTNIANIDESQYPYYKTDSNNNIIAVRHVQRGPHGQLIINYNPVSTPLQPTQTRQPSVKDTYQLEAQKQKQIEDMQLARKIQEMQDRNAGRADVPFARQAEEDQLRKDIEDIRRQRTDPNNPAVNPPPADSAAGHTGNYGNKVNVGDKVTLRDGRKVTVTAINPDGTVEYQ